MTLYQIAFKAAEHAILDRDPLDPRTLEIIVEAVIKVMQENDLSRFEPSSATAPVGLTNAPTTEPDRDWEYIPHGSTCDADHDNGSDWGKCGEPARALVRHQGRDRYVCGAHKARWQPTPDASELIGSGTPLPSAERSDSPSRSAAKDSQTQIVSVSLEEIETAKEELWNAIIAFANHEHRWKVRQNVESKLDQLLIQVVQAHAAQLQEQKEEKALARLGNPSVISDPDHRGDDLGDSMREQLAALAHEQWSGWMRHLFGLSVAGDNGNRVILNREVVHWTRQMATSYADLSEAEKDSDRKEADRVFALIRMPLRIADFNLGWESARAAIIWGCSTESVAEEYQKALARFVALTC